MRTIQRTGTIAIDQEGAPRQLQCQLVAPRRGNILAIRILDGKLCLRHVGASHRPHAEWMLHIYQAATRANVASDLGHRRRDGLSLTEN